MTVYVVTWRENGGFYTGMMGAYSSQKKAEKAVSKAPTRNSYEITETKVR